jgi:tetratricopeptide (TPR) repeat protein
MPDGPPIPAAPDKDQEASRGAGRATVDDGAPDNHLLSPKGLDEVESAASDKPRAASGGVTSDDRSDKPPMQTGADTDAKVTTPLSVPAAWVGDAAKVGTGIVAIALLVLTIWFVGVQISKNVVVIDPIDVPRDWQTRGITGNAITRQLVHDIGTAEHTGFIRFSRGFAESRSIAISQAEVPDIQLPEPRVSLQSVARVVRELLGLATPHVSILIAPMRRRYDVRIAVSGQPVDHLSFPIDSLDSALIKTAAAVVRRSEPALYAAYALSVGDTNAARASASDALTTSRRDNDAMAYVILGNIALAEHLDNQAIAHYRNAVERDPKLAQAYVGWGLALEHQLRFSEALRMYQAAESVDRTFGWAVTLQANLLYRQAHYREARQLYTRSIKLDPATIDAYVGVGDVAMAEYRIAEARRWYDEAWARDSRYVSTSYAQLERSQGHWDNADSLYAYSLSVNPWQPEVQLDIAAIDDARGRYDAAACDVRAARAAAAHNLNADNHDVRAAHILASIYWFAEERDSAAVVLQRLIGMDGDDLTLYDDLGTMWSDWADTLNAQGHVSEAAAVYRRADSVFASGRQYGDASTGYAVDYGYVRKKLKDTAGAVRLYAQALDRAPQNAGALLEMAATRPGHDINAWRSAVDAAIWCAADSETSRPIAERPLYTDECQELNVDQALTMARIDDTLGNYAKARDELAKILAWSPNYGEAEARYARDLVRTNQESEAPSYFASADRHGFVQQWLYPLWANAVERLPGEDMRRDARIFGDYSHRRLLDEWRRRDLYLAAVRQQGGRQLTGRVVPGATAGSCVPLGSGARGSNQPHRHATD